MKPRRSQPPTPTSNALFVAGLGFVPPVVWGLVRDTLDMADVIRIAALSLVAGLVTFAVSAWAYRHR